MAKMSNFLSPDEVGPLPTLQFETPELRRSVEKVCSKQTFADLFDRRQKWLSAYFSREILEGKTCLDLEIRWISPEIGYGVFATRPIPKGTYIGEYMGIVRERFFWKKQDNPYAFEYPASAFKKIYIDASRNGNITRFINHKLPPNVEPTALLAGGVLHIVLISILPIAAGEELGYDYGEDYWKSRQQAR